MNGSRRNNAQLRANGEELTVDFLNVGFGDSILIRLAWGEDQSFTVLVDSGDQIPEYQQKHPQRIKTVEHLKNENVQGVDLFVLTHFHRDHIADSLEIISQFPVKKVWLDYCLPERFLDRRLTTAPDTDMIDSFNIFNRLITELIRRGVAIELINQAVNRKIGPLTIKTLVPAETILTQLNRDLERIYLTADPVERYRYVAAVDSGLNRTCLALKLEYKDWAFLLPADLPVEFWPGCQADLKANVLKAPHHGDIHSLSEELLARTNPEYVVISVDNQGLKGFPSPESHELITGFNRNIRIFYTDVMPGIYRVNPRFVRFRIGEGTMNVTY